MKVVPVVEIAVERVETNTILSSITKFMSIMRKPFSSFWSREDNDSEWNIISSCEVETTPKSEVAVEEIDVDECKWQPKKGVAFSAHVSHKQLEESIIGNPKDESLYVSCNTTNKNSLVSTTNSSATSSLRSVLKQTSNDALKSKTSISNKKEETKGNNINPTDKKSSMKSIKDIQLINENNKCNTDEICNRYSVGNTNIKRNSIANIKTNSVASDLGRSNDNKSNKDNSEMKGTRKLAGINRFVKYFTGRNPKKTKSKKDHDKDRSISKNTVNL